LVESQNKAENVKPLRAFASARARDFGRDASASGLKTKLKM
jgi:hypothetical protein